MRCILILLTSVLATGCASPRTAVLDKDGLPVIDAKMCLDFPSFNGPEYKANQFGIIKYKKPLSFEVIQVRIESPTKGSALLGYPPPERIQLDGTRWQSHFKIIEPSSEKQ